MILIGMGANLPGPYGSPDKTLSAACKALENHDIRILAASTIWVTAPVPVSDQPWYRNAVLSVDTDLKAKTLLEMLKAIEKDMGRQDAARNAPRILDLDLLAYHDEIHNLKTISVPHPRLHERGFVLYPLQEVAPDWIHPVLGRSVAKMIETLPDGQKPDLSGNEKRMTLT